MPGINLEALNTGDLHRLLKVAHARQDGPLADRLEWEIAARATSAAHPAGPFATLPDDERDEPGFRMDATDDAPVDPELRAGAQRDPETATFEPGAPERTAKAPAPAARMAEPETPERSQWPTIVLSALAGCLLTAALVWGAERMGERAALKRLLPAQEAALAPGAPAGRQPDWPAPVEGPPAPGLAPLQQAFGGLATPPEVGARPVAVAQVHPKRPPRKPPARARAAESEAVEATSTTPRANRPQTIDEYVKQEEPIY